MQDIDSLLFDIVDKESIFKNEPMSKHTSFKIGGNADYFVEVKNIDELRNIITLCKNNNYPYFIIGNGTNLLVRDDGIRGIVIKLEIKKFDMKFENEECYITVGTGNSLAELSQKALQNEISGLEFAGGIPGTVGGAIRMNAGAFGGEMRDVVISTKCLDADGNIVELSNYEQNFGYRFSCFAQNELIILETTLKLKKASFDEIKTKMEEFRERRIMSQPIEYPSAGSIFKRNENIPTAKMIDECGLKGYRIGGAEISTKHAGFIINVGNAKANDVIELIELVKTKVKDKFNENVELEVLIIGG